MVGTAFLLFVIFCVCDKQEKSTLCFPEKLGIIKHDVVFFHFIGLISQKLPAVEI